ncbi:MAG: hypothetical protein ACREXR_15025 [Gammaproteobacteria bacterium]
MSALGGGLLYPQPPLLEPVSHASSSESDTVRQEIEDAKRHSRAAASSLQSLAYTTLEEVVTTYSRPDWDGYGARPISRAVQARARAFLDALPMWLPAPDIVPESDGEIAIEWDVEPNRIFSVSIGADGTLHYAGLLGDGVERLGVEKFDELVPAIIIQAIEELYRRYRAASQRRAG